MKTRLALVPLVMVALVLCLGCGSLNKELVDRMDVPAQILLPNLRQAYNGEPLTDKSGKVLTAEEKARRVVLLDEWLKTIKEAKAATEK